MSQPACAVSEFYVVRHGETEGNVRGIAQGRAAYPLTERGRRQAAQAAEVVRRLGWSPDHVVTSPVERCRETAKILARALGAPDPVPDEAFTEIDSGRGTGRRFEELAVRSPQDWLGFAHLGGESDEALLERVARGADALPAEARVLLVTHGAVFKALLAHLLGVSPRFVLDLRCGTCMRLARKRIADHTLFALTHLLHAEEIAGSLFPA